MDMLNKKLPTFKAEAFFYFSNFRLRFSCVGVCKLPWNDIEPRDNRLRYKGIKAAKVPKYVRNYLDIHSTVTGKSLRGGKMILQSERMYNYERIFNLHLNKGKREHHNIPDRARGFGVAVDEWNV